MIHTTSDAMPLSTARSRNTATASITIRARNGSRSALGWVRVSKTMLSPSLSRFFEMATRSSWHHRDRADEARARPGHEARRRSHSPVDESGVHHVTGRHGDRAGGPDDDQPPALVDAGGDPGQRLPRRELHTYLPPDGGAGARVRRAQGYQLTAPEPVVVAAQ